MPKALHRSCVLAWRRRRIAVSRNVTQDPTSSSNGVGSYAAMLALLYDIHGNLPALEAVIADAEARGATRWLIGGDVALFGPWPAETVARLEQLERPDWIRGNGERWTADPDSAPETVRDATRVVREALGDDLVARLGRLPESEPLDFGTRAWHASPVSDVRSFLPEPADDEPELLAGVMNRRLFFGHTHLAFRRMTTGDGGRPIELINPGSVGMPLDGDHRAAYALMPDTDIVELHRVVYDYAETAKALRERHGDEAWVTGPLHRFEHARMEE